MTTAVSDTGPLIALAKIQALHLLPSLYRIIYVPPEVYQEAVVKGLEQRAPDAHRIQDAFIQTSFAILPLDPERPRLTMPKNIHQAERESIQLSIQIGADVLLIDDWNARVVAEANLYGPASKIQIKGTLGVITTAFIQQLLSAGGAIQLLKEIKSRPDIWIHSHLCDRAIRAIQEASEEPGDALLS